jgi:hypothetical protein
MSRARTEERGQVIVLAAVMIPVFLLLTALVLDVGNWYTHKRQLQNRADAGAFAAGVAYAKNWKACVQTGDVALKTSTAQEIADAARQYAGDPDASDYAGGVLPTLENTQIANQSKLDVAINSTSYDDGSDYSDDYDNVDGTNNGDPCFNHPKSPPAADNISPGGGQWTDVKVKEGLLPSLAGLIPSFFGKVDPLSRNGARARIEIRPALSGHRFLPLAVEVDVIKKVQVRYFDECRDPNHQNPLAVKDLALLPAADQAGFASTGGGALWGLPSAGDATVGDKNLSFGLSVPSYGGCGQDYLPIGVQVRLASLDSVDLNQPCDTLAQENFADCFTRISQFRIYNDGNPDNQVRLTNVKVIGGCGSPGDGYFSTIPTGVANCKYDVWAEVNWGTRDDPPNNVGKNFTVEANGTTLNLVSWDTPNGTAIYSSSGGALTATPGANDVTISLNWSDKDKDHSWQGNPCNGKGNPCTYSATETADRTFIGSDDDSDGSAFTGAVALVRTSQSGFVGGLPGPPLENVATGGGTGTPPSPIQVYPSVGISAALKTGIYMTLRAGNQGTGLLRCDPDVANGQAFLTFRDGCKPWYGANTWTNWWTGNPLACPPEGDWFSYDDQHKGFGTNSSGNYWQCVPTIPGGKTGQVGDWMSVATKNCSNLNPLSCQKVSCLNDGNYDGKPGDPNGWVQQGGDSGYPRVVSLFIVPYQALKAVNGAGALDTDVPILGFASFYVMNWKGNAGNGDDPCPDTTFDADGNPATPQVSLSDPPKRAITGVFVETVKYEPGPVDPNASCVEGQLTPCRVRLVR